MKAQLSLGFINKLLFIIWYASFMAMVGLVYLVRRGQVADVGNLPEVLIQTNLVTGAVFLGASTLLAIQYLIELFKIPRKRVILAVGTVVILAVGVFIFSQRGHEGTLGKKVGGAYAGASSKIRSFYNALFYRLASYPPDDRMTTSDELLGAVNAYRDERGRAVLQKDRALCALAQERMNELIYNIQYKDVVSVRRYDVVSRGVGQVGEIVEVAQQKNTGEHIVEQGWADALSPQRTLLNDSRWNVGCATVQDLNIVFIFGRR